jgi:imidazoleglycerol phosphate dehydratase HisB
MPQVDQSHHTIESFFHYFNETLIRALEALRSPRIPSG